MTTNPFKDEVYQKIMVKATEHEAWKLQYPVQLQKYGVDYNKNFSQLSFTEI